MSQNNTTTWLKLNRSDWAFELIEHPNEFMLLSLIALRANYREVNLKGLEIGESFVDYKKIKLTRQNYRTALNNLINWGFVTTRVTTQGNAIKVCDSKVYDISAIKPNHQDNHEVTTGQPTPNHIHRDLDLESKRDREGNAYAFFGEKIKLNRKDFDKCLSLFPNLDLVAELTQLDFELRDDKKWFHSMNAKLRYRNENKKPTANSNVTELDDWMARAI